METTTYYRVLDHAVVAHDGPALAPGEIIAVEGTAPTLTALLAHGVLTDLGGEPGRGVAFRQISAEAFKAAPRVEPAPEPLLSVEDVCARLGPDYTPARISALRGGYGFPKPDQMRGGPSAESPDATSRPHWHWSTIEKWLAGLRELDLDVRA